MRREHGAQERQVTSENGSAAANSERVRSHNRPESSRVAPRQVWSTLLLARRSLRLHDSPRAMCRVKVLPRGGLNGRRGHLGQRNQRGQESLFEQDRQTRPAHASVASKRHLRLHLETAPQTRDTFVGHPVQPPGSAQLFCRLTLPRPYIGQGELTVHPVKVKKVGSARPTRPAHTPRRAGCTTRSAARCRRRPRSGPPDRAARRATVGR